VPTPRTRNAKAFWSPVSASGRLRRMISAAPPDASGTIRKDHTRLLHVMSILAGALLLPPWTGFAGTPRESVATLTADALMEHVRVLASDEFEGRAPGSHGEELTVRYLTGQFQRMGLKPGGPDNSWTQDVPMVGFRSEVSVSVSSEGKREAWQPPQDFVAWSPLLQERVEVRESELVFVGYGVTAPEYEWDDFTGADLRGETLVMLVGDPPVPDRANPARLDERMFHGKGMRHYAVQCKRLTLPGGVYREFRNPPTQLDALTRAVFDDGRRGRARLASAQGI
jgi:hypothetical protein